MKIIYYHPMPRVDILSKRKNARFDFFRGNKKTLGYAYFLKIENLVLKSRSEFNGFAVTGASSFGVLEYWSIGVMAKAKARISK